MLTRESKRQFESLNVVRDQTLQIPNESGTGCLVCGFSLGLFLHSFDIISKGCMWDFSWFRSPLPNVVLTNQSFAILSHSRKGC